MKRIKRLSSLVLVIVLAMMFCACEKNETGMPYGVYKSDVGTIRHEDNKVYFEDMDEEFLLELKSSAMAALKYFESRDEVSKENDLLNQELLLKARISQPDLVSYVGMDDKWTFINIKRVEMNLDGKEYVGVNDYSYEYENEDTYEGAIISGSSIIKEGELLITDYYLDKFGIKPEEYDGMIGKKISLCSNGKTLVHDFTLAGIVDSRIYYTDALIGIPQLIIRGNDEILDEFQCESIYEIYSLKDYSGLVDVYNELENEGWYINVSGVEEAVKCCVIEDSSMLVKKIISVFGLLLIMAFIMNIAQIIWNDLKNKESYLGISMVNGMNIKNVLMVEYTQLSVLVFVANIIAQIIAIILYNMLSKIMYGYIGIELESDITMFAIILLLTSVGASIVIFAMELPVLLRMVRKEPCRLLSKVTK